MSRIRSKDTTPELRIRRGLHKLGLRYRLNVKGLPGRPDIVFRPRKVAVFVHGCFWHGHQECQYFTLPKSRTEFWRKKIEGTKKRDLSAIQALVSGGWRVLVVWECALRNRDIADRCISQAYQYILNGNQQLLELSKDNLEVAE